MCLSVSEEKYEPKHRHPDFRCTKDGAAGRRMLGWLATRAEGREEWQAEAAASFGDVFVFPRGGAYAFQFENETYGRRFELMNRPG